MKCRENSSRVAQRQITQFKTQRISCICLRQHFVKKSTEPDNPREFWNVYRPFLYCRTKQTNDIILWENGVVVSDTKEIDERSNERFIQIAVSAEVIKKQDYGKDFENHPSITAIYEHNRNTGALCFDFQYTKEVQIEILKWSCLR